MKKIYILFLVFILVLSIYPCKSNALGEIVKKADDFTNVDSTQDPLLNDSELQSISSDLYNILLSIGIVLAVIIAMILGIQFMIGSVETQAKVKEALIPFVVGCVVVFGAFGIWKVVVSIGNGLL